MRKLKVTSRTCCSTERISPIARPPTKVRYRIMSLVVSVFPAPLSPLTSMDWLWFSLTIALQEREICHVKLHTLISNQHAASWFPCFIPVGCISNGKNMRTQFTELHTSVLLHHMHIIHMGELCKRIDSNQDAPCVCLKKQQSE